jgi:hypothetical protein
MPVCIVLPFFENAQTAKQSKPLCKTQKLPWGTSQAKKPAKVEEKPPSALMPVGSQANDMKREVISCPAPIKDADDEG